MPVSELKSLAVSTLTEEDLSLDLLDEVLATINNVTASDVWKRARSSDQCLVEVSINTLATENGLPTNLRGVIDLFF